MNTNYKNKMRSIIFYTSAVIIIFALVFVCAYALIRSREHSLPTNGPVSTPVVTATETARATVTPTPRATKNNTPSAKILPAPPVASAGEETQDPYDLDIQGNDGGINDMVIHVTAPNAMTMFRFEVTLLDNGIPTDKVGDLGDVLFKVTNSNPQFFPEKDIYPVKDPRNYSTKYVYDSNGTRSSIRYLTFEVGYLPEDRTVPPGTYNVTFSAPALNLTKVVQVQVSKDY